MGISSPSPGVPLLEQKKRPVPAVLADHLKVRESLVPLHPDLSLPPRDVISSRSVHGIPDPDGVSLNAGQHNVVPAVRKNADPSVRGPVALGIGDHQASFLPQKLQGFLRVLRIPDLHPEPLGENRGEDVQIRARLLPGSAGNGHLAGVPGLEIDAQHILRHHGGAAGPASVVRDGSLSRSGVGIGPVRVILLTVEDKGAAHVFPDPFCF